MRKLERLSAGKLVVSRLSSAPADDDLITTGVRFGIPAGHNGGMH
jgi:hypothetical protein